MSDQPFIYDPLAPMEAQRGRAWWITLGCEPGATADQVRDAYLARMEVAFAAGASVKQRTILHCAFAPAGSKPPTKKDHAE